MFFNYFKDYVFGLTNESKTIEVINGTQNVNKKSLDGLTFVIKGSSLISPPLIIPTYIPGSSQSWMLITYGSGLSMSNFTIYHTYNYSSSSLYLAGALFSVSSSAVLTLSYIIFTAQNPGMVILNPIVVQYSSSSVTSILYCDFFNISFQNSPLAYEDWNSKYNFTGCTFVFVVIFILFYLFL
jgi:hypothetical protein